MNLQSVNLFYITDNQYFQIVLTMTVAAFLFLNKRAIVNKVLCHINHTGLFSHEI